jgi:hypothetical protein
MKRVLCLLCGSLGLGCSAAEPPGEAAGGVAATPGSAGQSSVGGSGGMSGAAGVPSAGGGMPRAGAAGTAAGGSDAAGSANLGTGGSAGFGGSAASGGGGNGGAAAGGNGCVPDGAGMLSVVGETVHDAKTCLDWMKTTKTSVNYEAAETYCADAAVGGFDDWRIPDASEFASVVTFCGKYLPEGPIDTKVFDHEGDGYWTRTPAGELNKVCAVGMLNAGGYYHFGTAGPQVVRCVRGTGSVKMVKPCTAADGCSNW